MTVEEQLQYRRVFYKHRSPRWLVAMEISGIVILFVLLIIFFATNDGLFHGDINSTSGFYAMTEFNLLVWPLLSLLGDSGRRVLVNRVLHDFESSFARPV